MSKPSRKCIFCGKGNLSKEHIFSDWLRAIFPHAPGDVHFDGEAADWTTPTPDFLATRRQGHAGTRKLRRVCVTCNNEWIGMIDDAAKNVGAPLFRGAPSCLTPDMQKSLAAWVAKIAMVGDSRDPIATYVWPSARTRFMETKVPPHPWAVWIGRYSGDFFDNLAFIQHGQLVQGLSATWPPFLRYYLEATTIVIGPIVFLVIGTSIPDAEFQIGEYSRLMRRIWPVGGDVDLSTLPAMSNDEVGSLAYILSTMTSSMRPPAVPHAM